MKREYSLDVVKTMATVFIIFHHYQQLSGVYYNRGINFYNGNFYWGFLVELFFLLSGFFTWHYVERIEVVSSFLSFFRKKYMRFFLMLLLPAIVTIIVEYIYYVKICEQPFYYTLWGMFIGFLGLTRWFGCGVTLNNPMWYISVLLLCYTVFFLTTWIARKINSSPYYLYLVIVIFGYIMKNLCELEGYCWPLFSAAIGRGYVCFFWGIIFRNIWEKKQLKNKRVLAVISGVWIITFIYTFCHENQYIGNDLWNILCFMFYPAVIVCFGNKWVSRLFVSKKLDILGGLSFNAYLWHYPVIIFILIIRALYSIDLEQVGIMLLTAFLIFIIGALSRRYIEIPVESMLKRRYIDE